MMRLSQLLLWGVLALPWPGPAAPAQAAAADSGNNDDAAIHSADIPARANADERFARHATAQATADHHPLRVLTPQLSAIAGQVELLQNQFTPGQLRDIAAMRLESLDRHWKFESRRFERWSEQLNNALEVHTRNAVELAQRRSAWEASLAAPGLREAPAAIASRVQDVIAELHRAEQALGGPLTDLINLGRQANIVDANIRAGEGAVREAIEYIDARLLFRDALPLWELPRASGSQQNALVAFRTGLAIENQFAQEYTTYSGINQRAQQAFRVLLLPFLIWLAWRYRRSGPRAQPEGSTLARVLSRPLSSWLLLVMLGTVAFEPDAPLMVQQIAMLVAVIPVLRLLPAEAARLLGWWPYMASGLFLVENLSFLSMFNTTAYRLFQLGLTSAALAATLWQLWHSRAGKPQSTIGRAVRPFAWTAAALLAVGIVANFAGNSTLAGMLTSGVITSAYFGLLLYVGYTAVVALLNMLLAPAGPGQITPPLVHNLTRIVALAAAFGWLLYALNAFRIMRPGIAQVRAVLSHELSYGNVSVSLGHVLVFVGWIVAAFWIARIARLLLRDNVMARLPLPRGVGNSIASLTYYALLLVGFLFALSSAGFELSQLALILGALGVGIGFGLQNVVNNFVSGLILMFERPIQPGDVIEFGGVTGRVRNIGMRATTITTFDGADVVVPNGNLLSGSVTNWTLLDRSRRIEVTVGVAYGSDPVQVLELLRRTAEGTHGVATIPPPSVVFTGLGTSSLDFSVRVWTHDFDQWVGIRSELVARILGALRDAGVAIPFPQQDVHVRSISEAAGKALGMGARAPT